MPAPSIPAVVTRWNNYLDISGRAVEMSWSELFADLRTPRPYQGDDKHPGWSPVRCEPTIRRDENVKAICALVLDSDGGASVEGARELWAGYFGLVHTTRKHSEAVHRFRVVLPLSRHVTPAEHAKLWSWANARAVRAGHRLDAATRNPSRFWYEPGGVTGLFESHALHGESVDVDAVLAELEREAEPARPSGRPRESSLVVRIRRASHYLGKMDPAISGQGGHGQTWKAAIVLTRGFDLPDDVALDLLSREYNAHCLPAWSERELKHKIATASRDARVPRGYLLDDDSDDWHRRVGAPPAQDAGYEDEERAGIRDDAPRDDGGQDAPPPAQKPSPFAWVGTAGIFAPLPPTAWRVPGLQLCPGRPALMAAYGASGKTLASQAMLLACSAQKSVWGQFRCAAPLRCRHVDHEQGRHATFKRYQRLAIGCGIEPAELGDRLQVTIFPPVYLNSKNSEAVYCKEFEDVDLVVLDALRGATPGVDENDSKIRDCIDQLARVSEKTGTAFWIIHHAGKPKDGQSDSRTKARGSSAIFDACGSVFNVDGKSGEPKFIEHVKTAAEAEGSPIESFYLAIDDVAVGENPTAGVRVSYRTKEQIDPPTTANAAFEEKVDIVRDFIGRTPGVPGVERIAEVMRIRPMTVRQAVGILLERGQIVDRGTTQPKRPRLYVTSHEVA